MRTSLIDSPNENAVIAARQSSRQRAGESADQSQPNSTLIEFPGSRNVPEWRKRLSQRVREVQEIKAREAAEEQAAHRAAEAVSCALPSGQLELVPEPEQAPLNPIVSKALQRVDRARRTGNLSTGLPATAAAPAPSPIPTPVEPAPVKASSTSETAPPLESKPKLTIVSPPIAETVEPETITTDAAQVEPFADVQSVEQPQKRVRVISESVEKAALSYLENCLNVPVLSSDTRSDVAGLARRTIVGILDLIIIALLVSPAAAAIQFSANGWNDTRMIGLMAAVVVVFIFAYMTITIALTGRTLSMRLLSVKTIDARTGLIPTGGQSIKRAFAYVFSLALLGLGFAFAFIDRDRRTLHDRFSKTIVVHT
jgi:uncharacterized RDD family membrane protein YckC